MRSKAIDFDHAPAASRKRRKGCAAYDAEADDCDIEGGHRHSRQITFMLPERHQNVRRIARNIAGHPRVYRQLERSRTT